MHRTAPHATANVAAQPGSGVPPQPSRQLSSFHHARPPQPHACNSAARPPMRVLRVLGVESPGFPVPTWAQLSCSGFPLRRRTPLHFAATAPVAAALLAHGADVHAKNAHGCGRPDRFRAGDGAMLTRPAVPCRVGYHTAGAQRRAAHVPQRARFGWSSRRAGRGGVTCDVALPAGRDRRGWQWVPTRGTAPPVAPISSGCCAACSPSSVCMSKCSRGICCVMRGACAP
jgi:hypothetical protein